MSNYFEEFNTRGEILHHRSGHNILCPFSLGVFKDVMVYVPSMLSISAQFVYIWALIAWWKGEE